MELRVGSAVNSVRSNPPGSLFTPLRRPNTSELLRYTLNVQAVNWKLRILIGVGEALEKLSRAKVQRRKVQTFGFVGLYLCALAPLREKTSFDYFNFHARQRPSGWFFRRQVRRETNAVLVRSLGFIHRGVCTRYQLLGRRSMFRKCGDTKTRCQ